MVSVPFINDGFCKVLTSEFFSKAFHTLYDETHLPSLKSKIQTVCWQLLCVFLSYRNIRVSCFFCRLTRSFFVTFSLSSCEKQQHINGLSLNLPLLNKQPLNQTCPLKPQGFPSCIYISICANSCFSSEQLRKEDQLVCSYELFNYSTVTQQTMCHRRRGRHMQGAVRIRILSPKSLVSNGCKVVQMSQLKV